MTLLNDILKWTESLPAWQRDASRRLLQNEDGLEADDYSELYVLLKKENWIEVDDAVVSEPLASEHLPAEVAPSEKVTLVALRELENVNLIPNEYAIKFSETGMTVIYGGNGSGKSGYARVLKRACRARDLSEPIYPNANDPTAVTKVPTAKFDVKVGGALEEIGWSYDATPPYRLSTISVFDSKCARSYITTEQDVAYLPYGLDIVENLANQILPRLSEMLDNEIDSVDVDMLPFEHLFGETEVGKLIKDLSDKSDADAISYLGTLTEGDNKRIAELDAALKEADPLTKAEESRLSAMRLKAYSVKLAKSLNWVSTEAVENLQKLADERQSAEYTETMAANALRAGEELLPGTGDQAWKYLFEAARRYSTDIAFPGKEFPPSTEDGVCPLCQEELGKTGTKRLNRFNDYIKHDVSKSAEAAREKVYKAKNKIEDAALKITAEEALSDELNVLDASLLHSIDELQDCIDTRRDSMLNCLETSKWAEIPTLIESPRKRIRKLAAHQLKAYRTLVRAADEEKRKKLRDELSELTARQNLENSLKAVLDLLERMKRKASLEKCRPSLRTRPISDKSKEFAKVSVTEELKKALDKEFKALGIERFKTKLKVRNVKGKMFHQLLLDLPISRKIDEILSEGEQRAIALGSFFAELALANHTCGIVFDDPVSSLDHWRRRDVARRLVEEAKIRQVVVFTHDTSFLAQLLDEIEAEGIPKSISFLQWQGDSPAA